MLWDLTIARVVAVIAVVPLLLTSSGASTESVLWNFNGPGGSSPEAALLADQAGNFYGTTYYGGNSSCYNNYGCGVVFELTPSNSGWTGIVLHRFGGGKDGAHPVAGLVRRKDGSLYGTTMNGGHQGLCNTFPDAGCGVVFKLTHSQQGWTYSVVYKFSGYDGAIPTASLTVDSSGALYGTTQFGGSGCLDGCGTVFRLLPTTAGWRQTVIYYFTNGFEGGFPYAEVLLDGAGRLYGTTTSGGLYSNGTVFGLTRLRHRWKESILYNFSGGTDGGAPFGGVVLDPAGNLYGTTSTGGNSGCNLLITCGVVFELTPKKGGEWTESVIHAFTGYNYGDGANPYVALTRAANGYLYGTTPSGGTGDRGTVFELAMSTKGWQETVLYNFTNMSDGGYPCGAVILDDAGNILGTASSGGDVNCGYRACGVAFKVTP